MRSLAIPCIATLMCATDIAAAQSADDVATIRRLDSLWARMYVQHDTAVARELYAEDLVFTSANGAQKTREQELADVRPQPGLVMEYFRTSPTQVRVRDGAAVVTGVADWRFTWDGRQREVRRAYTIAYSRGGSLGWRILAVHMGTAP